MMTLQKKDLTSNPFRNAPINMKKAKTVTIRKKVTTQPKSL